MKGDIFLTHTVEKVISGLYAAIISEMTQLQQSSCLINNALAKFTIIVYSK